MTTIIKGLVFILLACMTLCSYGQVKEELLVEEKVKYQYDKKRTKENYDLSTEIGKSVQVNFDCCFDDSVHVYINNILTEKLFLKTDGSTSFTGHSLVVMFNPKKKQTILKIILTDRKVFCEINLDKKYRALHVNRTEKGGEVWPIIFRNFGIVYQ